MSTLVFPSGSRPRVRSRVSITGGSLDGVMRFGLYLVVFQSYTNSPEVRKTSLTTTK